MPDTVLIVPCFNEASRLDTAAFETAGRRLDRVRFLFVDDGSTDDTRAMLAALCEALGSDRASVLRLEGNRGKAEAVRCGVLAGLDLDPAFLGYWDADLSAPIEELSGLRETLVASPEVVAVLGARVKLMGHDIERSPGRHYLGRIFATGAALTLGFPVYDTQCGAKLFRNVPEVRDAFAAPFISKWAFDVELLARLRRRLGDDPGASGRIVEVPLTRWTHVAGSRLGPTDLLPMALSLWRIRRRYR